MKFKSKKLFSMFIDVTNEQIPALRQQYCEEEKNAFENAVSKKEAYQPFFYRLIELSEKISDIDTEIEESNKSITDINKKITAALADVSLIMKLKSDSGTHSCKINALNIARDSLHDDIAMLKMTSYKAYEEYFSAVREYTSAHEIRVTGDFIFTMREMIARSLVECNMQRGDSEVLHAAVYDYTKNITPSDGNYNRVIAELKNSMAQTITGNDREDGSLHELIGKYFTDEPGRHYEDSICRMALEASKRRNFE